LSLLEEEDHHHGILRTSTKQKKRRRGRDYMYDSKKVESEGIYHIVTWKNIEKTLWILFEHSYINLLLQIDCFFKENEQFVLKYIVQYRNHLEKLWRRISRFQGFLNENNITGYSEKEMRFICILKEKQHRAINVKIENLRSKYMPNIHLQREQQQQTEDQGQLTATLRSHPSECTLTDITGITPNRIMTNRQYTTSSRQYSPYSAAQTNRSSINSSNVQRNRYPQTSSIHFSANKTRMASSSSNVSSGWT